MATDGKEVILHTETELDELEWEDNPHNLPFTHHMIAGSAAGLTEHVFMFPVDTLKTHLQCEKCGSISPLQTWKCATGIVGREGLFRLWRGVSAMFVGCIPAHAAYFSVFEFFKQSFGADRAGHHPLAAAACGALASITHDSIMTPCDTVKQRMQLGHYKNVMHCVRTILKHEGGARVLYRSFPTTLAMNIPYGGIMVATNESMRKFLSPLGSDRLSFSTLVASGSVAGGIASLLTTPLDVIKTRLQVQNLQPCPRYPAAVPIAAPVPAAVTVLTQVAQVMQAPFDAAAAAAASASASTSASAGVGVGVVTAPSSSSTTRHLSTDASSLPLSTRVGADADVNVNVHRSTGPHHARGPMQIIKEIIKEEGMRGFFRGAAPRMMVHIPSVAVSWTTYDVIKNILLANE